MLVVECCSQAPPYVFMRCWVCWCSCWLRGVFSCSSPSYISFVKFMCWSIVVWSIGWFSFCLGLVYVVFLLVSRM